MLIVGDYVWYVPFEGCLESDYEKGRVKSISDENYVFVVYHCNNDWDNYKDYTGQRIGGL